MPRLSPQAKGTDFSKWTPEQIKVRVVACPAGPSRLVHSGFPPTAQGTLWL